MKLLPALAGTLISLLILTTVSFCQEHFTGVNLTSATTCDYAGVVTLEGNDIVDGDDEVGVFVSNGSGGLILIGACVMGEIVAGHYLVKAYPDDPSTIEKDGAYNNEELIFMFWDKSEDRTYRIPPASPYMTYEADPDGFLDQPGIPPTWKETIKPLGFLNLSPPIIPGDLDGSGAVALKDAILSLQIISGKRAGFTIYLEADVDGNSKMGMEEALYVMGQLVRSEK